MLAEPSPSGDGLAVRIEPALTCERRATPYPAGTDDVRGSAPLGGVGEQGGDLLGDVGRQWPKGQSLGVLDRLLGGADPGQRNDCGVQRPQVTQGSLCERPAAGGQQFAYGLETAQPVLH